MEAIAHKLEDVDKRLKELAAIIPADYGGKNSMESSKADGAQEHETSAGGLKDEMHSGEISEGEHGKKEGHGAAQRSRRAGARAGLDGHIDEVPRHEYLHQVTGLCAARSPPKTFSPTGSAPCFNSQTYSSHVCLTHSNYALSL
jgi:hypothetical protein